MDRAVTQSSSPRRRPLRLGCLALLALFFGLLLYARYVEPYWLRVYDQPVTITSLPPAYDGLRIVQLSDLHLGPWISLPYLNRALALANSLSPDLIVLTGDYVRKDPRYITPVYHALAQLHAPVGVYGVLGNHDQWEDETLVRTRQEMAQAGIVELTNTGVALDRNGQRLGLAGVADLWTGQPDPEQALASVPPGVPVILLSHNPDVVEQVRDPRVALMLSGHTHGGQVNLPLLGTPVVPSRHGSKYAAGLVRVGPTQLYINRGIGMAVLPFRLRCRPEITLLTLHRASRSD